MTVGDELAAILADLPRIKQDIAFARALRNLKVITTAGEWPIQFSPDGENAVIDLRSITSTGATPPSTLPSQTGEAGGVLTTDGATTSWL